jgi:hypothetical protein
VLLHSSLVDPKTTCGHFIWRAAAQVNEFAIYPILKVIAVLIHTHISLQNIKDVVQFVSTCCFVYTCFTQFTQFLRLAYCHISHSLAPPFPHSKRLGGSPTPLSWYDSIHPLPDYPRPIPALPTSYFLHFLLAPFLSCPTSLIPYFKDSR